MDVKMPDGTIIKNVPEGMTQTELLKMVNNTKMRNEFNPYKEAAQEGSTLENLLAGAGGSLKGMYLGGKQMLGLTDANEIADHKRAMEGLSSTSSGTTGQFLGAAIPAAATALLPGVNTVTGSAALGSLMGALEPVSGDESRLKNMALGGVLGGTGQGVANAVGRAIRPVQATLDPMASGLAAKAEQMGINLNAAQKTGSKPLRWIDSALDNLPMTAEKQASQKLAQREAWQRAALNKVGETADNATADVMGKAYDRIGQSFRDLSARNSVVLDGKAQMEIAKVKTSNAKAGPLSSSKVNEVTQWIDDLTKPTNSPILGANGKPLPQAPMPMSGSQYQEVRSILTRKAQDAFSSGDSQLGQSLKGIRDALDNAAERSISQQDAEAWRIARDQYKTLKAIEKATDPTTGTISPKKLVNELTRKNPKGMIYGKGDQSMADIAKVGKQFIAENLPDSGTAQRSWYMNMLQNPTAGLGGLVGFASGGPVGALGGAALGAATPLAAQRAMWNPAGMKYFTQGAFNVSPKMSKAGRALAATPIGLLEFTE